MFLLHAPKTTQKIQTQYLLVKLVNPATSTVVYIYIYNTKPQDDDRSRPQR